MIPLPDFLVEQTKQYIISQLYGACVKGNSISVYVDSCYRHELRGRNEITLSEEMYVHGEIRHRIIYCAYVPYKYHQILEQEGAEIHYHPNFDSAIGNVTLEHAVRIVKSTWKKRTIPDKITGFLSIVSLLSYTLFFLSLTKNIILKLVK